MPPAIFSSGALKLLTVLKGDSSARRLLADARLVAVYDHLLIDIAEDLTQANNIYNKIK